MSAEQYGFNLLAAVHEESLEQPCQFTINKASSDCYDQLLADVRHIIGPQEKSVLGIPQLDKLLESFRYPDEPAPRRPEWVSSGAPSLEYHADQEEYGYAEVLNAETERSETHLTKSKPAIIEFTSQQSASGKTNLLYYLATHATLLREEGGKQSAVVWIDNDGRFSASRLSQVLHNHLQTSSKTDSTNEPDEEATRSKAIDALTHIHVFRPYSSSQVLSILESLASYLLDQTRHRSFHRPLGLLIIDSATAFHAQDRFDADMARLDAPLLQQHSTGHPAPSKTATIISRLREIQTRFECAVLFTTTTTTTTPKTNNSGALPNQPPQEPSSKSRPAAAPIHPPTPIISPWTSFAAVTLQLERVRVPQFVPQMTLDQCVHDAERRLEVVSRGRFLVSVAPKTLDVRAREKAKVVGNVVLRITEDGVAVE
ncbi:uncharacterized protein A1O9_00639 [Exophiala aquamarina CBS 119918]|uniref:RecA family profile 1 domain-containing protein n=1 Tax=Exophiala aquamarina CBS 119918 TaxID=1182545 RepID=A0A072PS19_9EURO|nr:uncharacterized protein A1O9_00639 [Exophiala aquamarina CBS 119918]KEF62666.1 hypothetical protein A1O9_00639 [Exophiala aquamarina CBS 119918]